MEQHRNVYIKSATQISLQEPLSERWLESPVWPKDRYVRSQNPDFRSWLSPLESRRMGNLMRRALATSLSALAAATIEMPGAIVTGTGLGAIENTEIFLDQLCREGEECRRPTHFMQSTHNTVGSLVAIHTKCHAYNTTYSHKSVSFDSALLDAFLQLRRGITSTALVMGNDELTPSYFNILTKAGYVGLPGQVPAAEASVAMVLAAEDPQEALCRIDDVGLAYGALRIDALPSEFDAVMVGYNGALANDTAYDRLLAALPTKRPVLHYKHLFGECYSASALGLYASAHVLAQGVAPAMLRRDDGDGALEVRRLLFLNHSGAKNFSWVLMSRPENKEL